MFFAFNLRAQVQNTDVLLTINPEHPRSNEQVKATVSSASANISKSKVIWTLDGNLGIEGVGKKDFTFKLFYVFM